jgi:hypothetical protein
VGPAKIERFEFSARFKREFKKAQPGIKAAAAAVFKALQAEPNAHRCHGLTGYKPTVYAADVFSNHSWQITFEMDGTTAMLRRLARHADIDNQP